MLREKLYECQYARFKEVGLLIPGLGFREIFGITRENPSSFLYEGM